VAEDSAILLPPNVMYIWSKQITAIIALNLFNPNHWPTPSCSPIVLNQTGFVVSDLYEEKMREEEKRICFKI